MAQALPRSTTGGNTLPRYATITRGRASKSAIRLFNEQNHVQRFFQDTVRGREMAARAFVRLLHRLHDDNNDGECGDERHQMWRCPQATQSVLEYIDLDGSKHPECEFGERDTHDCVFVCSRNRGIVGEKSLLSHVNKAWKEHRTKNGLQVDTSTSAEPLALESVDIVRIERVDGDNGFDEQYDDDDDDEDDDDEDDEDDGDDEEEYENDEDYEDDCGFIAPNELGEEDYEDDEYEEEEEAEYEDDDTEDESSDGDDDTEDEEDGNDRRKAQTKRKLRSTKSEGTEEKKRKQ